MTRDEQTKEAADGLRRMLARTTSPRDARDLTAALTALERPKGGRIAARLIAMAEEGGGTLNVFEARPRLVGEGFIQEGPAGSHRLQRAMAESGRFAKGDRRGRWILIR